MIAELREHLEAGATRHADVEQQHVDRGGRHHGGSIGRMDRSRCVHGMIEAQVARTPDAVAVIDRGAHVTYRERRRTIDLILRPGDLIINSDAVLDRTLHIHVTREDDRIVLNLYGGGIDQAGLDELARAIAGTLERLAAPSTMAVDA